MYAGRYGIVKYILERKTESHLRRYALDCAYVNGNLGGNKMKIFVLNCILGVRLKKLPIELREFRLKVRDNSGLRPEIVDYLKLII